MPSVKNVAVSITRPANTTAYAAGDVISDGSNSRLAFDDCDERAGQGGVIQSAALISSANQATKLDGELWLFGADITDLDADNAAFTPTDDQLKYLLGVIDFATASFRVGDATAGAGGNSACVVANIGIAFPGRKLYGVLLAQNAYTPVSGEVFTVNLVIWR